MRLPDAYLWKCPDFFRSAIGFVIEASGARRPTAVGVRMEAHRAMTGACVRHGERQPSPKGHAPYLRDPENAATVGNEISH